MPSSSFGADYHIKNTSSGYYIVVDGPIKHGDVVKTAVFDVRPAKLWVERIDNIDFLNTISHASDSLYIAPGSNGKLIWVREPFGWSFQEFTQEILNVRAPKTTTWWFDEDLGHYHGFISMKSSTKPSSGAFNFLFSDA